MTIQKDAVHGITRREKAINGLKNRVENFILPSPKGLGYRLKNHLRFYRSKSLVLDLWKYEKSN